MKNSEATHRSSSRYSSGGRTLRNGKIIADPIKKIVSSSNKPSPVSEIFDF
jgi:hypothetical protein